MSGNGFYKPRNLEAGTLVVGKVNPMMQSCFAMEIRGSERHILGNGDNPGGWEGRGKC